jgi:hypothetical protein
LHGFLRRTHDCNLALRSSWGGLNVRFRWLSYAPDARGINGVPPDRCYALMTELTEENCDGVVMYGRLAIHATAPVPGWTLASRAVPAKFSAGTIFLQRMSLTDGPADLERRSRMMQPNGTIRFMGRYWFRDPWRQSYLEGDDWDD